MLIARRQLLAGAATLLIGGRRICASNQKPGANASGSVPKFHRDTNGLIVQADGDGGDTAQREGFVWFGLYVRRNKLRLPDPDYVDLRLTFPETMRLLEVGESGLFRRHPTQHNEPSDFSRDQQTPIVAAMGVWALRQPLERLWAATVKRGRVCQNGDAVGADHYNLFQRARGPELEIDPLGELQLRGMLGSFLTRKPGDVSDDLNNIVSLALASLVSPTRTSRLATKEYLSGRPHTCGSYLDQYYAKPHPKSIDVKLQEQDISAWIAEGRSTDPGCSPAFGALRWYFRPESGGNPGIAELYRPIVNDYLVAEGNK
jgi:hypothetical protein